MHRSRGHTSDRRNVPGFREHVSGSSSSLSTNETNPGEDHKELHNSKGSPHIRIMVDLHPTTRIDIDKEQSTPLIPRTPLDLKPAHNPPRVTIYNYLPILRALKFLGRFISRKLSWKRPEMPPVRRRSMLFRKLRPDPVDTNVPIQISLHLSTYFAWLMSEGLLTPASATTMINAIGSLQDTVANLERVLTTPIPFAYQVHLRLSLWYVTYFYDALNRTYTHPLV